MEVYIKSREYLNKKVLVKVDDDKLIVVPEDKNYCDEAIMALTEFQEQYFESVILK